MKYLLGQISLLCSFIFGTEDNQLSWAINYSRTKGLSHFINLEGNVIHSVCSSSSGLCWLSVLSWAALAQRRDS